MAAHVRRQSVDVYRGLAILAMATYHALWDLNYFGLISVGIGIDPVWIGAQRAILTSFLLLAGAGLALGHSDGIHWRRFWRREALLITAAVIVSIGTWFAFGEYFAYFGVLHALALFMLMALPLVSAPFWIGGLVALLALLLPAVVSSDLFNPRWLNWLGFFRATPETADLVPVFPWFGVVLIGMLGMRGLRDAPVFAWSSRTPLPRGLALLGRWSLLIYLLHQPLVFGGVMLIANWSQGAEQAKLESFVHSCTASCEVNGTEKFCRAYCSCALDVTVRDNLWTAPVAELEGMGKLCTAMATE